MMKNKLSNLNTYLFEELERLSDKKLLEDKDALINEINRSKAISQIATNIVSNANVILEASKFVNNNGISTNIPDLLGIEEKNE